MIYLCEMLFFNIEFVLFVSPTLILMSCYTVLYQKLLTITVFTMISWWNMVTLEWFLMVSSIHCIHSFQHAWAVDNGPYIYSDWWRLYPVNIPCCTLTTSHVLVCGLCELLSKVTEKIHLVIMLLKVEYSRILNENNYIFCDMTISVLLDPTEFNILHNSLL